MMGNLLGILHFIFINDYDLKLKDTTDLDILDKHTTVDWYELSADPRLNNDLIEMFEDYLDWNIIIKYQKLDDEIIIKYFDKLSIDLLYKYQKLSEYVMSEKIDELDFNQLVFTQDLSENFIMKHIEILDEYDIKHVLDEGIIKNPENIKFLQLKIL